MIGRRYATAIVALILLTPGAARAVGPELSTLFECRLGVVKNPGAFPTQWTSEETTMPFALLFKREPGDNLAGKALSVLAADPAKLLPLQGYSVHWSWPSRVGVIGASGNAQVMMLMTTHGRPTEKLPTFSTLTIDPVAKTARAAIFKMDGPGNVDPNGAVVGSCKIELGDPAVARFQEISK